MNRFYVFFALFTIVFYAKGEAQPGLSVELNMGTKKDFSISVQSRMYNTTGLQVPSEMDTSKAGAYDVNKMYNLAVQRVSNLKHENGVLMNSDLFFDEGFYKAHITPYNANNSWIVLLIHALSYDDFKESDTPRLKNPMIVCVPINSQANTHYVSIVNLVFEPGKFMVLQPTATCQKSDDNCVWVWNGKKHKALKTPAFSKALQCIRTDIAQNPPTL